MKEEELLNYVSLKLGCRDVKISDRFYEDLNAESMDLVHLIVTIEEKTGLNIPEEVLPDLKTVADLLDYVNQHPSL